MFLAPAKEIVVLPLFPEKARTCSCQQLFSFAGGKNKNPCKRIVPFSGHNQHPSKTLNSIPFSSLQNGRFHSHPGVARSRSEYTSYCVCSSSSFYRPFPALSNPSLGPLVLLLLIHHLHTQNGSVDEERRRATEERRRRRRAADERDRHRSERGHDLCCRW